MERAWERSHAHELERHERRKVEAKEPVVSAEVSKKRKKKRKEDEAGEIGIFLTNSVFEGSFWSFS